MFKVKFNKLIAMLMSIVIAMEFLAPSIRAFASDVSTDKYYNGDTVLETESNAEDEAKEEAKEKNQYKPNSHPYNKYMGENFNPLAPVSSIPSAWISENN